VLVDSAVGHQDHDLDAARADCALGRYLRFVQSHLAESQILEQQVYLLGWLQNYIAVPGHHVPRRRSLCLAKGNPIGHFSLIGHKLEFLVGAKDNLIRVLNPDGEYFVLVKIVLDRDREEGKLTRCDSQCFYIGTRAIAKHLMYNITLLGFPNNFDFAKRLLLNPLRLARIFNRHRAHIVAEVHFLHTINSQPFA